VLALRSKRGLRSGIRIAEPQVAGLTPQTTSIKKADTLKTYLLRNVSKVQSQPQPMAPRAVTGPALYISLDVHTDSIAVSLAPSDSPEVQRYGLISGGHDDVLRLAKKLQTVHPQNSLRFCYQAGPHGYPLCRCLRTHGYHCILVSLSKMPRKPGERIKTNRRDADQLARLYRAGELTGIYVPDPQDEAVRDLVRARYPLIGPP
jgi:hypothetical protein